MNRYTRQLGDAIAAHMVTIKKAEIILEREHGIRHAPGQHSFCPRCKEHNAMNDTERQEWLRTHDANTGQPL